MGDKRLANRSQKVLCVGVVRQNEQGEYALTREPNKVTSVFGDNKLFNTGM